LRFEYVLGKNRFDKFLRSFPGAITAAKAVKARIAALVAAANDAEGKKSEKMYTKKITAGKMTDNGKIGNGEQKTERKVRA